MLLPQAIHLEVGEKVLYHMRASGWSSAALYASAVVCVATLYLIPLGLALAALAVIRQGASAMTLTNRRLIAQCGRRRYTVEVPIDQAKGVEVVQGPIGHLCNQGTVVVYDLAGKRTAIPAVMRPLEFQRHIGVLIGNSRIYRLGKRLLSSL